MTSKSGGPTDTAVRHGNYFFDAYGLTNTTNAVFSTLAVSDGTTTSNLPAFLAGTPEPFTYDDDGNLTRDGRFVYGYDGENRLSTWSTTAAAVAAGHPAVSASVFYDYLGRRIRKVDTNAGLSTDRRFIYHGWNEVAEFFGPYNGGNFPVGNVRNSFWGVDLSGTMQGAGGVGGLLMVQEGGNTYLPMYDALGNIHGMIKAADGSLAAAYEYDAFGNTLRESGPYAASNPWRFATKYADTETGLVQYNTRYYSPSLGRFINRDSIGEQGGLNLYAYVGNNAVNKWDYLGQVDGITPEAQSAIDHLLWSQWVGTGPGGGAKPFGQMRAEAQAMMQSLAQAQHDADVQDAMTRQQDWYAPNRGLPSPESVQSTWNKTVANARKAIDSLVDPSRGAGANTVGTLSVADVGAAAISGLTLRGGASINLVAVGSDATFSLNRSNGVTTRNGEVTGALGAPTGVGAVMYATVQGTIPLYNRPTDFSVGFLAAPIVAFGITVDFSNKPTAITDFLGWRFTPTNIRFDFGLGAGGQFKVDIPNASTTLLGIETNSKGDVKKTNAFDPNH